MHRNWSSWSCQSADKDVPIQQSSGDSPCAPAINPFSDNHLLASLSEKWIPRKTSHHSPMIRLLDKFGNLSDLGSDSNSEKATSTTRRYTWDAVDRGRLKSAGDRIRL
ncbi:hypothetical protein L3Y34_012959 [Caenorhabditis briggsae]|uniref:Uncharacterized protein n=1 Tax=Caenorhabditis briggsae TaxID=6238 RepID=A0AAE8ZVR8_CAEBR|nr:hypothetical protein L3Y34_012959 [Caenorhabditis briggsae]